MIHVVFEDGTVALFSPGEIVIVCDWLSEDGEYFASDTEVEADDIAVGKHILGLVKYPGYRREGISTSKVAKVQLVKN